MAQYFLSVTMNSVKKEVDDLKKLSAIQIAELIAIQCENSREICDELKRILDDKDKRVQQFVFADNAQRVFGPTDIPKDA